MRKNTMLKELQEIRKMSPEEYEEYTKRIYTKHTKKNDGRCPGYYEAGAYVNEVYSKVLEQDFIDEVCNEHIYD